MRPCRVVLVRGAGVNTRPRTGPGDALPIPYSVTACSGCDRQERVGTIVPGILDVEAGKLHMTIR